MELSQAYNGHCYSVCTKYSTFRRIACIGTRTKGLPPQSLERRALEGTVTEVPANAFTININLTNGNVN